MQSPVPAFSRSLKALSKVLAKAEAHCEANNIDPDALLTARLFPDMFHLISNVLVSCDTAKGTVSRLSQTQNPSFEDTETSFAELQERITKTLDYIKSVPDTAFEGAEDREVLLKAGGKEFTFNGTDYMASFGHPNFYFHVTTAYNILRHNGVELGKKDLLGA